MPRLAKLCPETVWMPARGGRRGRTIGRHQIATWHRCRHADGPAEAINGLVRRIKRLALGVTSWTNYRTRALL